MIAHKRTGQKVFLVIPTLIGGGAERVLLSIAQGLRDAGMQPSVFTFSPENDYGAPIKQRVLTGVQRGLFKKIRSFFKRASGLSKAIANEHPTAILSFMPGANATAIIASFLSGRRKKLKLIVSERSVPSFVYGKNMNLRGKLFWKFVVKLIYPLTDFILTNSHGAAKEFKEWSGLKKKVIIIPNPLPIEQIKQKAKKTPTHPWMKDKIPFFVSIGRLSPEKDYKTQIRALAHIRQKKKVRLIIIGKGNDEQMLKNYAQQLGVAQDVLFLGFEPNPYPYLARSAGLIHASLAEGLPNVILEAMALGKPVIATDCPTGPREIIGQNKYGVLVRMKDDAMIAAAAEQILSSKKYASKLSKASLERAQAFNSKKILPHYIKLLSAF